MARLETIVVGYDSSDPARRALERAADLAEAFGAALVVTTAQPLADSPEPVDREDFLRIAVSGEDEELDPPAVTAELAGARAALAGRRLAVELVPALGDPADAIVELAEERNADLIVVGTGEPGLLERLLGQSVSASVTRQAGRDVLIVH